MKILLTIIVMLTIAPIMAAIGLISFDPSNWGGSLSIGNILAVAFFGVITVPLSLIYIPSLIIVPIIMRKISHINKFQEISYAILIFISILFGVLIGVVVFSPLIIMVIKDNALSSTETIKLISNWMVAGALSGAVSLPIITLIYRHNSNNT